MADAPKQELLEAHYQKSNFFRVVHADASLGANPSWIDYRRVLQRTGLALPRRTSTPIVGGVPGSEEILELSGVLREIEVNVIMDIAVAANVHAWLGQRIAEQLKNNSE